MLVDIDREELRRARIGRLLSQTQASELAGIARWTLGRIESGRTKPQLETLKRVSRVYGRNPRDFLAQNQPEENHL